MDFPRMSLQVVKASVDGQTGIVTYQLRVVEEEDENTRHEGPLKDFSIDGDSLRRLHEGSIEKWLGAQKDELVAIYQNFKVHRNATQVATGTMIPVEL